MDRRGEAVSEEIVWKDPPNKQGTRSYNVWVDRLTPLTEHPKRWAMVVIAKSAGTAGDLRKGRYVIPEGNWEFRTHQLELGAYELYARYLGPKEEKPNG